MVRSFSLLYSGQLTSGHYLISIVLTASDGYSNAYSWSEIFNTIVGDKVYIITAQNGVDIAAMPERILVMSLADKNSGSRHLKGLQKIEVKKPD